MWRLLQHLSDPQTLSTILQISPKTPLNSTKTETEKETKSSRFESQAGKENPRILINTENEPDNTIVQKQSKENFQTLEKQDILNKVLIIGAKQTIKKPIAERDALRLSFQGTGRISSALGNF